MIRQEFAALLVASFAVGLYAQGRVYSPDWTSAFKVPQSLAPLHQSITNSSIWGGVRSHIRPYVEQVNRAAGGFVPSSFVKSWHGSESSDVVSNTTLAEAGSGMTPTRDHTASEEHNARKLRPKFKVGGSAATDSGLAGGAHSGEEVDDDRAFLPPSGGGGVQDKGTADSHGSHDISENPEIPDIEVSRERNDTIFRFRFQYRLKSAKRGHDTSPDDLD